MASRKPLLAPRARILLRELRALFPEKTLLAAVQVVDMGGTVKGRPDARIDALVVGADGVPELGILLDAGRRAGAIERALPGLPMVTVDGEALERDPIAALHRPLAKLGAESGDSLCHPDAFLGRGDEHPRTGLTELDRKLGALWPGELVLLGGTTGAGKSSFLRQLAIANAFARALPTLYVSLEATLPQIGTALLAAAARVDPRKLAQGDLSALDGARVRATSEILRKTPLSVVSLSDASASVLEAQVRRHAEDGGKLVLIDYLELLGAPAAGKPARGEDKEELLLQCKRLARRYRVPIVIVCNALTVSRIHRADGRPDLLDVGDLGLHADKVLLLHREEVYEMRSDNAYITEAIIAKSRGGPTGMVTVAFYEQFQRFEDLEVSYDDHRTRS